MTTTRRSDRARRPAAVLWDMDGTLVDTEPYWIECEFELVEAHGGTWSHEHAHAIVGSDLHESGRYIRDHGGVDLPIDEIVNQLLDGVIARVRRARAVATRGAGPAGRNCAPKAFPARW